jgi:hypothetical protein
VLPPVLEVYIVWHPGDVVGRQVADEVIRHFHGTPFTGLIGGAVEIYVRSEGWRHPNGSPRPIPFPGLMESSGADPARLTVVVPLLGLELADAVQGADSEWYEFIQKISASQRAAPRRVGVFPLILDPGAADQTVLGEIFNEYQRIGEPPPASALEDPVGLRCRDLAQGIAQLASQNDGLRLTVFISHTKWRGYGGELDTSELVNQVRSIIADTRLDEFFDASDLQPGSDWAEGLRVAAGSSALLAIRTDLYASRTWCQREMLIAKCQGMPIVVLDALGEGEERGSFLMDHVPRVPIRQINDSWSLPDIRRGLNLLVDDCLKRALWRHQKELAAERPELDVAWWAPHAPEPATLVAWLENEFAAARNIRNQTLRIIHPDPPLGDDELSVLQQVAGLAGMNIRLDVMTPRLLAARGG